MRPPPRCLRARTPREGWQLWQAGHSPELSPSPCPQRTFSCTSGRWALNHSCLLTAVTIVFLWSPGSQAEVPS